MYAKVFRSLWDGSMRGQPHEQLVFVYMLAHANEDGEVDIVVGKIADDTGLTEVEVGVAVATLEAPDPRSRSANDEGRRLLPLYDHGAWGWRIVNYGFYRNIRNAEDRRRQNRDAQARYVAKKRALSIAEHPSAESAQVEVEVDAEVEEERRPPDTLRGPEPPLSGEQAPDPENTAKIYPISSRTSGRAKKASKDWTESFSADFWPAYPRPVSKGAALFSWLRIGAGLEREAEVALFNEIMDGLDRWKSAHKDDELEFTPHPATWLNQRKWEDGTR